MPYALVIIGLVLVVTGVRNTHLQMAAQLQSDAVPFTKTAIAIGMVGALGYVDELRGLSRLFMALIILALFLANKGFFGKLQEAINAGPAVENPPAQSTGTGKSASGNTTAGPLSDFLTGFFRR